jgi:cytochrome c553
VSYVPTLEGQTYEYLLNQLRAFKEKRRPSDGHQRYWGERSETDLQAIARHFASRARVREPFPLDPGKVAVGQARAQALMCATCHQPDYAGRESAPRLAGLHPLYNAAQIAAFASGKRPHPRIDTASGISTDDAEALAQYFAQIP